MKPGYCFKIDTIDKYQYNKYKTAQILFQICFFFCILLILG